MRKIYSSADGEAKFINSKGEPENMKKKDIRFWLPTYQYFIELPFRIIEADAVSYLGSTRKNDMRYDRIMASWNTLKPQRKIDQYILWINEDGILDFIEYTIRDQYGFLKGSASVNRFDIIDGVWVPTEIEIMSNLGKEDLLHKMVFSNYVLRKG